MPTNEERRDVAKGLRNLSGKYVTLGEIESVLGMDITSPDVDLDRDAKNLDRLADLIEPEPERTCKWCKDEDGCWHTQCGEIFVVCNCESLEDNRIFFCHNCGAKVVE